MRATGIILPALLSRTAFRTDGSFIFVLCSFDDSKVLMRVYLNKEYFDFEFEFEFKNYEVMT